MTDRPAPGYTPARGEAKFPDLTLHKRTGSSPALMRVMMSAARWRACSAPINGWRPTVTRFCPFGPRRLGDINLAAGRKDPNPEPLETAAKLSLSFIRASTGTIPPSHHPGTASF